MEYFNVKMRASEDSVHISGAELIICEDEIYKTLSKLYSRAYSKFNNFDDCEINVKIQKLHQKPTILKLINSAYIKSANFDEAISAVRTCFIKNGITNIDKILDIFFNMRHMRGAMILDIHTLKQLLPDLDRGVRISCIDYLNRSVDKKDYVKEAMTLSTKASHAPGIVGEITVSDDDYPNGCIFTPDKIMYAVKNMKKPGMQGGRIYLFDSKKQYDINETISYMENTPVLVDFSNDEDQINKINNCLDDK